MNKTKIVTIASHKGGVGKTTSAVTLGSLLSSKGKKNPPCGSGCTEESYQYFYRTTG